MEYLVYVALEWVFFGVQCAAIAEVLYTPKDRSIELEKMELERTSTGDRSVVLLEWEARCHV
jgi:hypothetical protein